MDPAEGAVAEPAALSSKSPKSVSIALPTGDAVGSASNQQEATDYDDAAASVDTVAWPINRCCYEELKPHDLATVEQLFVARDDAPSFMKWVVVHRPPHSFAKRLLVLSSFRVWLFKRRQTPFNSSLVVSRELQLLHLSDMRVLRQTTYQPSDPTALSTSIKMRFHTVQAHGPVDGTLDESNDSRRTSGHGQEEIHFDPGIHGETIVRLYQRTLHALRLVFPGQQLPRLTLPPQCNWQEFFTLRETHRRESQTQKQADRKAYGDAMAMAYRCFCDDLGVPYRESVSARLRECLDAACVDFQYCLSTMPSSATAQQAPVIPSRQHAQWRGGAGLLASLARWLGLHAYSTAAMQAKEVHALARTLERCHDGFEDVVVYDFAMSDVALRSLLQTLRCSPSSSAASTGSSIKGLSLTNVGLRTRSLRTLQHVVLQSTIRHGTGTAGATGNDALALRRLDLSFNAFSALMAHALATTLELLPGGLEVLQLEQCRMSMLASARVLGAMKASHGFSSGLRELNLSGNTLGVDGTRALALWITGAFALHRLDLSRTRLQTNAFFRAFQQNSILHESSLRALDLSYNRMGTPASAALGDILGKTQSLSTLVLRGMKQSLLHPRRLLGDVLRHRKRHVAQVTRGLRTVHLRNILGPMLQNSARASACRVDLSENDLRGAKAAALAHLVDSAPNASLASLRVDDAALGDKQAVLLLHALRGCKTLSSLSLEGNGFTPRNTKQSYRNFHRATARGASGSTGGATIAVNAPSRAPPAVERAAADALALLLGGKTAERGTSEGNDKDSKDSSSAHSFTHLYLHHHTKRVPLRELSLRASGSRAVFGESILTGVVSALATNATLQLLDVSGNECGDALARALGAVLPANRALQALYWDDNFTTVEGFGAFYDGLLRNQTLSVVQLPINDTRRILEEQKDPPRERLFSVLGKIFKVTERNQTLRDRRSHDHKSPANRKKAKAKHEDLNASPSSSPSHRRSKRDQDQTASEKVRTKRQQDEPETKEEEEDDGGAVAAASVDVLLSADREPGETTAETSWAAKYATRSRYPTTIQSWSRDGGHDDRSVRASWDQIGALASMLT